MNYKLTYAVGFHPWEAAETCPAFAGRLIELVAEEEAGREPPYGRPLDIGTGSSIWATAVAQRGWDVTGVDIVDKALRRPRSRVAATDVDVWPRRHRGRAPRLAG